jgi:hypothetical protein
VLAGVGRDVFFVLAAGKYGVLAGPRRDVLAGGKITLRLLPCGSGASIIIIYFDNRYIIYISKS